VLTVTAPLSQAFEAQLGQRNVPDQQRRDFHKWLRFYLDCCTKYHTVPSVTIKEAKSPLGF